ncbi:uncharacterized protein LOC135117401 [Helicoverpa armigera]|uniref:uncharacterized protein LOC135117401 n=1 Tax=Helicoverpa armigera TaxID=29058 RepID=UPI003083EDD9
MLILEWAANDLDEIKKIIAKELLTYEDYYLRSAIYESMEFVDGYTTGLNVWNQYPMNKDMVLAFIGLITSYTGSRPQHSWVMMMIHDTYLLYLFSDYNLKTAVEGALEYIDVQTMELNLWNQFPLNINLVLGFMSMITCYMIALLQFAY